METVPPTTNPLPNLQPILDASRVVTDENGKPTKFWTTGPMTTTFFNRSIEWFNRWNKAGVFTPEQLPPAPKASGGASGNRVWTLPNIEALAYALFESPQVQYFDVAELLRTLDVVYAAARLQGLIPQDLDPIAALRPALSHRTGRR